MLRWVGLSVGIVAAILSGASLSLAASFQGIGDLPGGQFTWSMPAAISADGSTVVGHSASAFGTEAFRWTVATGMVGLGDLVGGTFDSEATGVSADGSVVAGSATTASGKEAFRWTSGSGMGGLGDLPGGGVYSAAYGISADGSAVVGFGSPATGGGAFRWTADGGMVGLGDLAGGSVGSTANATSVDGSVVVGHSFSGSGVEAFRWTSDGGMVGLGDLLGGIFASNAYAISGDGLTIVGNSGCCAETEAFRWTASDGMVGLGYLSALGYLPAGAFGSSAKAISADGSIIVGDSIGTEGTEAVIWDTKGLQQLDQVLINDFGLDLTGWSLETANGIAADGKTIVGYGINPAGFTEAWIATIPEPSTALLVALGLVGLATVRKA